MLPPKHKVFPRLHDPTPSTHVSPQTIVSFPIGIGLGIVGTGIGVGIHSYSQSSASVSISPEKTEISKQRIKTTYGYSLGGLCVTAGTAFLAFRTGLSSRYWNMLADGSVSRGLFLSTAITCTPLIGTLMTSFEQLPLQKHSLMTAFIILNGVTLGGLCGLGNPLLARAVLATACILGASSAAAYPFPVDDAHLQYQPIYGACLGALVALTLARILFPLRTNIPVLEHCMLYGGLVLFSAFLFVDTKKLQLDATKDKFDPINVSLRLYLDATNMFLYMVRILEKHKSK